MKVNDPSPSDYLVDPLSPLSRAERRNLLLASFIGFLMSKAGLIPTKLSAFGIELSAPQQSAFFLAAALVIGYFLLAFLAYSVPDLLVWRKKYQGYLEGVEIAARGWTQEDQWHHDDLSHSLPNIRWLYRSSPVVAYSRLFFDYVLPVLFAGYNIYVLLRLGTGSG
ncbi:hypothetical protein JT27_13095 [Alcaligenes faecalis]|uniref:hypothetical protein n=1 Tax=Alcaligenes faecalis TaxID=511 RepID=UPI00052CB635|nr:hypothetical protein [Alcaligenes faecalis]KGP01215.1 hypothetical protein JT27_13095 [Alcaligenes faecalis]